MSGTVLDLAKTAKDAVQKKGMIAWQYNTVGVSDAITMGGDGSSPERNPERNTRDPVLTLS
jgi:dihydroxyacid dehydratase/phosphogluconate dehydratase